MKTNLLKYYVVAVYFLSVVVSYGQTPGSGDTTGTLEGSDPPAPIDGYVYVLAVVGLIYVFQRFVAHTKQVNTVK